MFVHPNGNGVRSFQYRRRLLDQPDGSAATSNDLNRIQKDASAGLVAAISIVAAYLLLDSIIRYVLRDWQRARQGASAAGPESRDPDRSVRLQDIPVRVYVGQPSGSPTTTATTSPQAEGCPVCLGEYEAGEELRVLPKCGHAFHKDCIDQWLSTRYPCCPICRSRVIS